MGENEGWNLPGRQLRLQAVSLKGAVGHVILGNLSTDQMVIEFTKISKSRLKTIEELK